MAESLAHIDSPAIGFLDSGFGGLSILAAVQQSLPDARYLYLSDHAFFPYGDKSEEAISKRVVSLGTMMVERYHLDILVLACNTASTVALPALRARSGVPVVGVVPAIKPAAALSRSKVIGLLATEGTVRRPYTDELVSAFAPGCQVVRLGCPRLVEIAEEKLRGRPVVAQELAALLAPFARHPQLDTMVLACTHFPHIKDDMAAILPQIHHWVDSGGAVARRTELLLGGFLPEEPAAFGENTIIFTSPSHCTNEARLMLRQAYGLTRALSYRC